MSSQFSVLRREACASPRSLCFAEKPLLRLEACPEACALPRSLCFAQKPVLRSEACASFRSLCFAQKPVLCLKACTSPESLCFAQKHVLCTEACALHRSLCFYFFQNFKSLVLLNESDLEGFEIKNRILRGRRVQ